MSNTAWWSVRARNGVAGLLHFDGRIDNLAALPGHPTTDAEGVAAAYRHWGEEFPRHLEGDFAIVIEDRQRQRVILARDQLGVKPLYYYLDGGRRRFGSAIAPFFDDPAVPKRPNEAMIAQYLAGDFRDPHATFFTGVQQVPPAHTLRVDAKGHRHLARYWDLEPAAAEKRHAPEEYAEQFRTLFEEAAQVRLRHAAPIGLLLSGGLDSTQIAAMVEVIRRRDPACPALRTVTLLTPGFLQEEWEALGRLHETFGTELDPITLADVGQTTSPFELFLQSGETPHTDGFPTMPSGLTRLREKGCRVALTGFGANELSYPMEFGHLQDLLRTGRWGSLAREIRRMAWATHGTAWPAARAVADETAREFTPYPLRRLAKQWINAARDWATPTLRRHLPTQPILKTRRFPTLAQERTVRALTEPSFALELNQMEALARACGIEARHPFLDRRLIEYWCALPPEIVTAWGYRKMFIQRALHPIVPGPLRAREDPRQQTPELDLRQQRTLELARLGTYLLRPDAAIYHYVRYDAIRRRLEQPPRDWQRALPFLWRLAILQHWFDVHFQQEVPDERSCSTLSAA